MDTQHLELLRGAYAAFNARDLARALSTMLLDVEWPNGTEGGHMQGHAAIREYWTRQRTVIDPYVEPLRFHTERDDRITVTVHQVVGDLGGRVLHDRQVEHVYRLHDGLIAAMEFAAHLSQDPNVGLYESRVALDRTSP